jgi:hypothetical protein
MFKEQILNQDLVKFITIFGSVFLMAFIIPPLLLISLVSYQLYFSNLKPVIKYGLIAFNTILGLFFTILYYIALWENWTLGAGF